MKLRIMCCLVMKKIVAVPADSKLPAWASKHMEVCEHCRLESAAYSKMKSALKEHAKGERSCRLAWGEIRALLPAYPKAVSRIQWRMAYSGIAAFVLLLVFISMAGRLWVYRENTHKIRPNVVAKTPSRSVAQNQSQSSLQSKSLISNQMQKPSNQVARLKLERAHRRYNVAQRVNRKKSPVSGTAPAMVLASDNELSQTQETQAVEELQEPVSIPPELSYETGRLIMLAISKIAEQTQPSKCAEIEQKVKKLLLPLRIKQPDGIQNYNEEVSNA